MIKDGCILFLQIPFDGRPICTTAVPDITDVQVEMVTPEKWRHYKRLTPSENVPGSGLTLSLCHNPMLHSSTSGSRVRPVRDVTRSKDSGHVRFQELIHEYAIVSRNSRLFNDHCIRPYAD